MISLTSMVKRNTRQARPVFSGVEEGQPHVPAVAAQAAERAVVAWLLHRSEMPRVSFGFGMTARLARPLRNPRRPAASPPKAADRWRVGGQSPRTREGERLFVAVARERERDNEGDRRFDAAVRLRVEEAP